MQKNRVPDDSESLGEPNSDHLVALTASCEANLGAHERPSGRQIDSCWQSRQYPLDPHACRRADGRFAQKSRSFFTRANSRLSRAISSSLGLPLPLNALLPLSSASRRHLVSRFALRPSSLAIRAQLTPGCRACSTAPRLISTRPIT
jgi:hypothetical protein